MQRAKCIEAVYPELADKLVVTNMGACAQELYNLGHRDNFFYLQHAMGLASSIGLGLATSLARAKVVVLDGDGSVLMNLGTFATLARYKPSNLVHIVFDNGSLLSTGGFPSHTADGTTNLAAIARGAGVPHVDEVSTAYDFIAAAAARLRTRRAQRDRRPRRRHRPRPLRHAFSAAGKCVSVQTLDP